MNLGAQILLIIDNILLDILVTTLCIAAVVLVTKTCQFF